MNVMDRIFALSPAICYVALARGGQLSSHQRPELTAAATSESDRYEELLAQSDPAHARYAAGQ